MRSLLLRPRSSRGLTTMEILALMAVVVIALAVAWPLWTRQRAAQARHISANNLRQWGLALNLYLGESQNVLPLVDTAETVTTADQAWFNALPPYLSQPMLKDLPLAERPGRQNRSFWCHPAARLPQAGPDQFNFAYGMNYWFSASTHGLYKIHEIENPMAVVFLAEVEGQSPLATPASVVPRHGSGPPQEPTASAHFLFCDGHVELLTRSEFSPATGLEEAQSPSEKFTWVPFTQAPPPHQP